MELFALSVSQLMDWLGAHQQLAYFTLFWGSYFETLIGPGFFIPGEIFFLSGSILAGIKILDIGLVALACYGGGILGDSSSYFIGKWAGASIFKKEIIIFNEKNYKKGEEFFKKHGKKAIFLARLLGPMSWITPFLAGTYQISYGDFLKYNIAGIFAGIGEFLVVGYFFGNQYAAVLPFIQRYFIIIIAAILLLFTVKWYFKRNKADQP